MKPITFIVGERCRVGDRLAIGPDGKLRPMREGDEPLGMTLSLLAEGDIAVRTKHGFRKTPPEPRWRTKDGRELTPAEMATQHIRNALAMMERRAAPRIEWLRMGWYLQQTAGINPEKDYANDVISQGIDAADRLTIAELLEWGMPIYRAMREELAERARRERIAEGSDPR